MLSTLFFVLMYCSALTSFLSVFRYHFVCRTLLFCLVQTSCHFLLFFLKHCLIKYSVVFKMEDIVFLCCNQLYPMFSHLSIPFLKFSLNYFFAFCSVRIFCLLCESPSYPHWQKASLRFPSKRQARGIHFHISKYSAGTLFVSHTPLADK